MGKRGDRKRQKISQKRARRNEEREQRRFEEQIIRDNRIDIVHIPNIIGADFQPEFNDINAIQSKINALPIGPKPKILFESEASYLRTGFSTYMREVLKRLDATGKITVAEHGSYGNAQSVDPRAKEVKWKYYHNMPTNQAEENEYRKDYTNNQFGKWKLNYVLADYRPDIVIEIRDRWMGTFIKDSTFRKNFQWFWMPTVDGYPQKWEWLSDYSKLDKLFAYSWFGKRVLEEQSMTPLAGYMGIPPLTVLNVMQPGVDTNIFKPMSKAEVRNIFGVPQHIRFVGTVMRNQPRKLFTRIIESFRMLKQQHPIESKNVMLLLHTSIPDVGWDIPEIVRQNGLQGHVFYSYMCPECGLIAISEFIGSPAQCPSCGKISFHTPNTQEGFKDEFLAMIYNLMDVYIQGSIAEGDGMPINEAKCCGTPVLCSDYSAMYEKARNGGALPIRNDTIYTEHETGQWRSLFDRQDLVDKIALLISNENKRMVMSQSARECGEKYYTWDLCAKKWEYEILSTKIKDRTKTWEAPIEIRSMTSSSPPNVADTEEGYKEWLEWCYVNILGRKGIDPQGLQHWTRALTNAPDKDRAKNDLEKHFRKMITDENAAKEILQNPERANSDPTKKVLAAIEEIEGANV